MNRFLVSSVIAFISLTSVATVQASITILPTSPTTANPVSIRVDRLVNGSASITAGTIARSGTNFTVHQDVSVDCSLPAELLVGNIFNIGTLPEGIYTVNATMVFHGGGGPLPCSPPPVTQTATFVVTGPAPVPLLSRTALGILILLFAGIAVARTR